MAVQAINLSMTNYKQIALKIAFDAQAERARLNQKYWDELLEKLRKAGGGGSNDSRFDRVTVSMQLMNFLSNKMIQAMIKNFKQEFLNTILDISKQSQGANQNVTLMNLQKIGKPIFNLFINVISLIIRRDALLVRLYDVPQQTSAFIGVLSFGLNKLKEILLDELKELIKRLNIKDKMRKIKTMIFDFFVEMKEEALSVLDFVLDSISRIIVPLGKKQLY